MSGSLHRSQAEIRHDLAEAEKSLTQATRNMDAAQYHLCDEEVSRLQGELAREEDSRSDGTSPTF